MVANKDILSSLLMIASITPAPVLSNLNEGPSGVHCMSSLYIPCYFIILNYDFD